MIIRMTMTTTTFMTEQVKCEKSSTQRVNSMGLHNSNLGLHHQLILVVKKKPLAAKKAEQKADTYESLQEKHKALQVEMSALESKIEEFDAVAAERKRLEELGDLDAYMVLLEKSAGDSKPKMQQNLAAMKKVTPKSQDTFHITENQPTNLGRFLTVLNFPMFPCVGGEAAVATD
jgi:hypothetical protein